ncbi:MAG: efflux RND transporter permease subunit [Proteobacteria bacterium]|nr:efflux RND transporter permease subunit [Pseudomonadota bacterium]
MANFTDIFIRRPVLATVISLLVLVLGLRAVAELPIRQFPKTENATVTVTTLYYGASAELVAGFITTPIESAVAEAQGIDYLTSSSVTGASTVTAVLRLNYDSNRAQSEISSKVNSVLNQLPPGTQQPVITVQVGEQTAGMYIGFNSETLPANQITDYVIRVVQPKLQAVPGVQQAQLLGGRPYALRAWLDPVKLAANGVTAADVSAALQANNYLSTLGATKGQMVSVDLTAGTDLHSAEEFRNLIVKQKDGGFVRLKDLGSVVLGSENYDSVVAFKGKGAVFVAIRVAPDANILTVMKIIRKEFPQIQAQLPAGLHAQIGYDATGYIRSAIRDVVKTLVETLLIVTLVIFLFLGSVRSVIVPVVAMPLSLIGAFFIMLALGYTINLLTLLALVLAIGLVVDDAIIVVENVDRHMKLGQSPAAAALAAARELAGPIIAISLVLVAVYVPIGFQGGLTGSLFSEFAFTLAGAVAVSALIALTLSPMMCARFFRMEHGNGNGNRLVKVIDHNFERVTRIYHRLLHTMLGAWKTVVAFGAVVVVLLVVMMAMPMMGVSAKSELAPPEDQSFMFYIATGPANASIQQMAGYQRQAFQSLSSIPEYENSFQFVGQGVGTNNMGFGGIILKDYAQRSRGAPAIQQDLQQRANQIAGANVFWVNPPSLPGAGRGYPVEFVIQSAAPFNELYQVSQAVLAKAQATGKFWVVENSLKLDKPQTTVTVDRDKAALLGLTMKDLGAALSSMLGGGYTNYFSIAGRSYKVIPQVLQDERLNPRQVGNYYIRTASGEVVPASTVISFRTDTEPQSIDHFQRLNSATIQGVYGGTQGEALAALSKIAKETLPQGYTVDFGGASRQFKQESGGFMTTLGFAIVIIFLVLAALFESFRDPLVILMSVPMAIFGAVLFLFLGFATLNVYTQVGLVTLVGLIAKHGILIVQFANDQQRAGRSKREAIEEAATIRLRPILMTSASMVVGVVPLLIATGAGAMGRYHMGLVIFTGISIGTLFTLFVVPAMYMFIGAEHHEAGRQGTTAAATEALPATPAH